MDYNVLKDAIKAYVKDRTGLDTIDGDGLQESLLAIVNSIGAGYVFMGVADLTTNPGTPDQRVWYLASTAGIYANFNNTVLGQYEIAVLKWDTEWHKEVIPDIPSKAQIDARLAEQDGRISGQDQRLNEQDTEIADFKEAVQNQVDNYPMITINGNVTNAPDEEDITTDANDLLKFKNRSAVDGMGYKILRKGTGLTFANQVTDANTIYEVRYDFDLDGASVAIPSNCVLKFNGGKLCNGTLLDPFCIDAPLVQIFDNIVIDGRTTHNRICAEWFGVFREGHDNNSQNLQRLLNCSYIEIFFQAYAYYFDSAIVATGSNNILRGTSYNGRGRSSLFFLQPYTAYSDTNYFITYNCYNIVFDGIHIHARLTNDETYCNGLYLKDGVLPGQIDCFIKNCCFENFNKSIENIGRGIFVENCSFNFTNTCLLYNPATTQASQDATQNPPYDGRCVRFSNNRIHWLNVSTGSVSPSNTQIKNVAVALWRNGSVPNAAIVGFQMQNNMGDVFGGMIISTINIRKAIISGNTFNCFSDNHCLFAGVVEDLQIIGNNLSYNLPTQVTPGLYAITFYNNINGLTISYNTISTFVREAIVFTNNNNTPYAKNVVISGNVITNRNKYRALLALNNNEISNINIYGNSLNTDWDDAGTSIQGFYGVVRRYSAVTLGENIHIEDYTNSLDKGIELVGYAKYGTTANRPSVASYVSATGGIMGLQYFDISISPKRMIFWNGSAWVNMDGSALS